MQVYPSRLVGEVSVSGAKNSALKHLAASLLTSSEIQLDNFPAGLLDIQVHIDMLKALGKRAHVSGDSIAISEPGAIETKLLWNDRSIRNTLLILGCLTARFGEGCVPLPGGCNLGDRKYDLHVMVLERLGAKVWEEDGYLHARSAGRLTGADIHLPIRSTGATENAILCGALAQGTTTIWNPHVRPEVLDLVEMLRKMGARIEVHGQQAISVVGEAKLRGAVHSVMPDNMEALTWAMGATMTQGDVEIHNFPFDHLNVPLAFLRESGMKLFRGERSVIVRGGVPYPIEISTGPYPGINSDMQPLFAAYGALAKGTSKIIDLRFPGRYAYAGELQKLGAVTAVDGDLLLINGGRKLVGATVNAVDLRAGIALLLAGLTAEGPTTIENSWQITRGYEHLTHKLALLGAKVE
ncbi:MAG: UDP-N-acetylglucosamine 1-carboxyvinyltransferase [Proteobacteria bacterium]|nr:MAG: UDP-N-acetylglucosamine 1-carboxyvinyltransferase [Pseudomonadota bacterium]